jgi:hypothetical protein
VVLGILLFQKSPQQMQQQADHGGKSSQIPTTLAVAGEAAGAGAPP